MKNIFNDEINDEDEYDLKIVASVITENWNENINKSKGMRFTIKHSVVEFSNRPSNDILINSIQDVGVTLLIFSISTIILQNWSYL